MNSMSNKESMKDRVKGGLAEVCAGMLIKQAHIGMRNCFLLNLSEPKFPIELMEEDTD